MAREDKPEGVHNAGVMVEVVGRIQHAAPAMHGRMLALVDQLSITRLIANLWCFHHTSTDLLQADARARLEAALAP